MSNKRAKQKLRNRRNILKDLLRQCTEKQQGIFERMYGSIDKIKGTQIPWATKQCERTIEQNSPKYKLEKALDSYTRSCHCLRCLEEEGKEDVPGMPIIATRMILCPKCGNKRCPHATDHRNECTNSNVSGQKGSIYE